MDLHNRIAAQNPVTEPASANVSDNNSKAKGPESIKDMVNKALEQALNTSREPELNDTAKKEIHAAGEEFENSMKQFQDQKTKPNILSSLKQQEWIHWVNRNVFHDECFLRKIFSLENELAEALDPTFEQLRAPKWVRNGFYRVLWAMTFLTTGFRSLYEAINQEKWIAGLKKVAQDGVSVVALTTVAARIMNAIQEKVYNGRMPHLLKNILRPVLTIGGCIKGIKYFDMIGEPVGEHVVKFAEKLYDRVQNSNKVSSREFAVSV